MITQLLAQLATTQYDSEQIARYQTHGDGPPMVLMAILGLFGLVVSVIMIASMWRIFQKAGQPGWTSIIPIYNYVILLQMVGQPIWLIALVIFPCTSIFTIVFLAYKLVCERFGQGLGFFIGTLLLPPIFLPMLAFGGAQFTPPPYPQNAR